MSTFGIDVNPGTRKEKTGTEWYTVNLVAAMQKQLAPGDQILLYSTETLTWPFNRLWTQVRLSWEMLRRPPNVLFVPAHVVPPIHPKKTMTTVHDLGFKRYPQLYESKARHYLDLSTKMAVKACAKLIVPSEFTKQELIDLYHVAPEKIVVTPLAADTARFGSVTDEAIDAARVKYRLPPQTFLSVSRVEAKKNLATVVRAFEIFKQARGIGDPFQLALAGKPGFGHEAIETMIQRSPVRDSIHLLGFVPDEDIPALMAGAYTYLSPSWYEGFGISALEALTAGTALVASSIPPLREVAADAALYIDPQQPEQWAEAMTRLANDGAMRADLIAKGKAQAAKFSWDKTAAATWAALRSVL